MSHDGERVLVGFINPITWGWDKISGYVKEEAVEWITSMLGWLVTWVLSGVAWITGFIGSISTSDVLQPPDLSAEWFAQGVYKVMLELGVYGAVVAFIVAIGAAVISADWSQLFKRTVLQGLKWGFFTGLFLEGAGLAQQAMTAAERAVGSSGLGGNAQTLFESFKGIADAASTSGALAGIMAIFTGIVLIAGGIVMIALKVVVNAMFVVMAVFGPLVAVSLFSKRPEMLGRYLVKLAALGLAPFMMTASLAVGATLVMSTIGGEGFAATIPPPPTESSEPVDVLTEQKKAAEAKSAEEAGAGLLVVSMISALGVMIVSILSPAAPAALIEFTSDSTVRSASLAAVGASVVGAKASVGAVRTVAGGPGAAGGALRTLLGGGSAARSAGSEPGQPGTPGQPGAPGRPGPGAPAVAAAPVAAAGGPGAVAAVAAADRRR